MQSAHHTCHQPSPAPSPDLAPTDPPTPPPQVVLNTVACMFAEYCSTPFEVEPVEVIDSFGESHGEG